MGWEFLPRCWLSNRRILHATIGPGKRLGSVTDDAVDYSDAQMPHYQLLRQKVEIGCDHPAGRNLKYSAGGYSVEMNQCRFSCLGQIWRKPNGGCWPGTPCHVSTLPCEISNKLSLSTRWRSSSRRDRQPESLRFYWITSHTRLFASRFLLRTIGSARIAARRKICRFITSTTKAELLMAVRFKVFRRDRSRSLLRPRPSAISRSHRSSNSNQ